MYFSDCLLLSWLHLAFFPLALFCVCFSVVSASLLPSHRPLPPPLLLHLLLLLFLSSGAPSIRLSGAASGRLPATIFHRQPAKQLTAQPPPGNCFGCERNFKHRHTASPGPPKHRFPVSLSFSLSLLSISLLLPTHISMSLCISLCLSLFFALSYVLISSLFAPPSLYVFLCALPCSSTSLTHSHKPTCIVFSLSLLSVFVVPSLCSPSPSSPNIAPSPFPSSHSSLPLLFTTHREQGVVVNV